MDSSIGKAKIHNSRANISGSLAFPVDTDRRQGEVITRTMTDDEISKYKDIKPREKEVFLYGVKRRKSKVGLNYG